MNPNLTEREYEAQVEMLYDMNHGEVLQVLQKLLLNVLDSLVIKENINVYATDSLL